MMKLYFSSLFLSVLFMITGCESADGEDIHTSGMYAEINIDYQDDMTLKVDTGFKVGGALSNTYVDLESGATVIGTLGSESKTLTKTVDILNKISYHNTFVTNTSGTDVVIALTRPDDTDAPNSTGVLFSPLVISQPNEITDYSNSDIPFTWEVDSTVIDEVYLDATCFPIDPNGDLAFHSFYLTNSEILNGSGTILKSSIDDYMLTINAAVYSYCQFEAYFIRSRTGTVDPAYEGGYVHIEDRKSRALNLIRYP